MFGACSEVGIGGLPTIAIGKYIINSIEQSSRMEREFFHLNYLPCRDHLMVTILIAPVNQAS